MSFPEERQVIEEKIQATAGITALVPLSRIAFPNAPIADPAGLTWIQVNFIYGDGSDIEIRPSPRLRRYQNVLVLQVFQKEKTGTREALTVGKAIKAAFKDLFLSVAVPDIKIRFRLPKLRELGDDGLGFYQINVECPYKLDVIE